jgi:hypothetical protein
MAIGMVGLGLNLDEFDLAFALAYWCLGTAAMWTLGTWLTSDTLRKIRTVSEGAQKRRKESNAGRTVVKYRVVKLTVSLVICLFASAAAWLTHTIELKHNLLKYAGVLLPATDATPPNSCHLLESDKGSLLLLLLGDGDAAMVYSLPHTAMVIGGTSWLVGGDTAAISLERAKSGSIAVDLDIKDAQGRIIVRMGKDGFQVNQHLILGMKRPDRSTLIVSDEYGNEVLNARYINRRVFRLTGIIRLRGRAPIPISYPGMHNFCLTTKGLPGGVEIMIP